jgi:WS/DGAT/MGAT family acyltransferase
MPAADAAWLHMDRDTNPMVVNSLSLLAAAPPQDRIAALLEERLVGRFPRFRQHVVDAIGRRPAFEDDPAFDIEAHLHRRALPAPGDRAALEELVGDLVSAPLDPNGPLWHTYLIEGFEGERAAVLWRIHHCIADGIALSQVLLSVTDEFEPELSQSGGDDERGVLDRLASLPGAAVSASRRLGGAVVHEGMETLAHPSHLRELAGAGRREAGTAAKLIGAPADARTPLRARLSGTRRVAWSEPFALEGIRDSAHRRRVTINDLLLTALAGALRKALLDPADAGSLPEAIHAMVPFNLRSPDEPVPADLGNDFALILLELPLGDVSAAERLREVSSRMDAIKRSNEGAHPAMARGPPDRLLHREGEPRRHQRAGAPRAARIRGRSDRGGPGLGALLGQPRDDSEHLQL